MIRKIAFISHRSKDVAADKHFYGDLLGLPQVNNFESPEHAGQCWVEYETPEGKTIAIENFSPEGTQPTLALETDDIEAEVDRLRSAGVQIVRDVQDNQVCKMAWILDPSGNTIMLHEIAPDRADHPDACKS